MTASTSRRYAGLVLFAIALAAPAVAGSVSGRLLDAAGKPVAGAAVSWMAYRTAEETLVDDSAGVVPTLLGEVHTDAEGRWRVTLEKPGAFSLEIAAPGAPMALLDGPYEGSEEMAVDDVVLPEIRALKGTVVDEAGQPMAGVRVQASPSELWGGEVSYLARATTGPDGTYQLPAAPRGTSVSVRARGFVPHVQGGTGDRKPELRVTLRRGGTVRGVVTDPGGKPAAGAVVSAGRQAVRAGEDGAFALAGVGTGASSVSAIWKEDFVARKDGVRIRKGQETEVALKLAKAASISGTVVDEATRKPIAGVKVTSDLSGGFREGRSVRTDGRGKFRIGGLAPNRYAVEAVKPDYLTSRLEGIAITTAAPGSAAIALRKAASVAGRVTDERGEPVAGARVRLAREAGPRMWMRAGSAREAFGEGRATTSGPDGSFKLRGLAPAKNATVESVREGYVSAKQYGLQLRSAQTVSGVALTMRKGLEAKGRVVDAAGQPVSGAEVRVTKRESGGSRMMMVIMGRPGVRPDATSGNDGAFVLKGLEAVEYTVSVSRDGYSTRSIPSVEIKTEGENRLADVVLEAGEAIAGLVRSGDGAPVVGARVFAWGERSGARDAVTDGEGRFRIDGLSGGRAMRLSVNAEGFANLDKEVTPPSTDLILVLKTGGTIRGRVEDADTKKPVTEFSASYVASGSMGGGGIMAFRLGGADTQNSFQSADGSFELANVPPGKWGVEASAAGYRPGKVSDIELGEGETREGIVVPLRRGGVVTGSVLDPRKGTGVPNAQVSWQEAGSPAGGMGIMAMRFGDSANSATTDADGRFQFDGLPDGKVTVTASHTDFVEASRTVEVSGNAAVEITLGTGGAIAGQVIGKDGRSGIAGAEVGLQPQGGAMFGGDQVRTDGSGNFLFENLKAGRYKVTAQSAGGTAEAREVVLGENQRVDGVSLTLASGALIRGTISGLPQGQLGGLRVSLSSNDYQSTATADDAGAFTFRDVPPGVYSLMAYTVMVGTRAQKSIEVPAGATEVPVEIVFEGSGRLAGRVTRAGRGIGQLFVSALPDPPGASPIRASARTDDDGAYVLENLPDGNYQLIVGGIGVNHRKLVTVQGDTAGDIELSSIALTGYVTDAASGEPLEGATVQVESGRETDALGIKRSSTDSRGYYAVDGLESGSWQVSARKEGYQAKSQPVTIGSTSSELSLALARGAGLAIHAVDGQTGLALRMVSLLVFGANGSVAHQGFVALDNEGKGELAALAPGRYTVYAFAEGYAPRNIPSISVPSGTLALAFTPGGAVEIRSAGSASGRILDAGGSLYMARWGRLDGQIAIAPPVTRIEHLAPGSYRLVTPGGSESFTVAEGRTTTVEAP